MARFRGRALERRLARDQDTGANPLLRRRARQLARPATREAAACGLERVVRDARRPQRQVISSAVPVRRDEVLFAEPALLALIDRLRNAAQVNAAGVAEIRLTLSDGAGPFYLAHGPDVLRLWAGNVLAQLDSPGD